MVITGATIPTSAPQINTKICPANIAPNDADKQKWIEYAGSMIDDAHRLDLLATWWAESGFTPASVSKPNTNGTKDHGICQLNSAYHSQFINSPEFQDPYKQLDYCVGVYRDALNKKRALGSVWYGWAKKDKYKNSLICQDV